MTKKIRITVVGAGYVGMSLAALLAQHNEVMILDIDSDRVKKINNRESPVSDYEINSFLAKKELDLKATLDKSSAYKSSSFVVIATPTNYDENTNRFDTSSVDSVVSDSLKLNPDALVVIKSTIPVGHTKSLQEEHSTDRIIFSPEFLREGQALKDNLYPSRIIVGSMLEAGIAFADLLVEGAKKRNIEVLFMPSTEAEAVKLFSNSYLAMRVSYFNELDSYAMANDLDTKMIIDGVCLDGRIGKGYNNPSFGYGGYCLPKDTKQLMANYAQVPQTLIKAIVSSNKTRKDFIAEQILKLKPKTIGFYRLIMKQGSDNFRSSAIQGIIRRINAKGVNIVVFEPELKDMKFCGLQVIKELDNFKKISDIVVTNRMDDFISDISFKCFSRDLFGHN